MSWRALGTLVWIAACLATTARAAEQEPNPVRFEIRRFEVDGNTLLPQPAIDRVLAPYRGSNKDFADIQRALSALEQAYRDIGYGVVQIALPEQNITQGEIRFVVTEPRVGRIIVEGNKHFNERNIRASVPSLVEGKAPNSRAIARSLQVANENPAKQTQVLLRAAESEDRVDAAIKVTDDKLWKVGLTLDNTGTASTGKWRAGASYQHANIFDLDHVLTAQYITSPGHWSDVRIYGAGYRMPVYSLGASIDLIGGYSDVNSGTLQNLFSVSGSGTIFAFRYNQQLPRIGDYEQRISYGLDYRAYQNRVAQVAAPGGSTVPDITVHPVNVFYSGQWRKPGADVSFYLYAAQNVFAHGNDASDSDFKASRARAKAAYRIYRYNVSYLRALPGDFQGKIALTGQETRHALVSGEQFGLGGADNVRGFLEREIANDRGQRLNAELTSPDLAALMKFEKVRARLAAFYDWGHVSRRFPQPGESIKENIAAAGFGVRIAATTNYALRLDVARVLEAGGSQNRGDWKAHVLVSAQF
jgi:hemolysin activation/secretion protein